MSEESAKYWQSGISEIEPEHVFVRGYDLEDLIGIPFGAATYLLIKGELPSPQQTKVVDALLTAVLDYGLEKAGTVAARAVVSSNPSMQAGLATAILAAGEHSLAPENAARFITERYQDFEASGLALEEFAAQVVADARERRYRIPGFGHPVFKFEDPRSIKLRAIAEEQGLWSGPALMYEAIHREFVKNPKVAHFPINDVGVIAAISTALGFTPAESTALAVIGTLPGVAAHITEETRSGNLVRRIPSDQVDYRVPRKDLRSDAAELGWADAGNLSAARVTDD